MSNPAGPDNRMRLQTQAQRDSRPLLRARRKNHLTQVSRSKSYQAIGRNTLKLHAHPTIRSPSLVSRTCQLITLSPQEISTQGGRFKRSSIEALQFHKRPTSFGHSIWIYFSGISTDSRKASLTYMIQSNIGTQTSSLSRKFISFPPIH